jgi:hypothetical protein
VAREDNPNARRAGGVENPKDSVVICRPFSICFTSPTCMSYTTS